MLQHFLEHSCNKLSLLLTLVSKNSPHVPQDHEHLTNKVNYKKHVKKTLLTQL